MEALQQLLRGTTVCMRDGASENILHTIKTMQQQGKEKLMVIADFDMTLTQYYVNGGRGRTSFGVIETSELMPAEYRQKVSDLRGVYAPMEVDPTLSQEEMKKAMLEWYSQAHNLLVEFKVKKADLKEIVSLGNIKLREGCDAMLEALDSDGIPLVILSAGIADTLILTIEAQSSMRGNISVISNYFQFGEAGEATGFSETMITSSNKGNLGNQFKALSGQLKGRSNVILIGDSLGDPQMVQGMEDSPANLLKIGFLNDRVEKLLDTYLGLYDIVLVGDGDMALINQIIQFICTDD